MAADHPTQRPLAALAMRLCAALILSAMFALAKLLSESGVPLVDILFWRQVPTIVLVLCWLAMRGQLGRLRTERPGSHGRRAVYGVIGMVLNFGAVTLLPLAEATTLNFTSAIWAVILSSLLLKEAVGRYRWAAVLLGFIGVVVITQPGHSPIPLFGAAVGLGAAFMIALISIQIRDLGRTEEPLTVVFYFALFSVPMLLPVLLWQGAPAHSPYQWALLAALGLTGLLGQLLLTASLRYGSVASVIVMDYSALIWATLFGFLLFDRLPSSTTWLGAPMVVLAGLIIAWREHHLSRRTAPPTPPVA
ncbi:DMT family transporter [Altererythrobacter sp. CAU 1778]